MIYEDKIYVKMNESARSCGGLDYGIEGIFRYGSRHPTRRKQVIIVAMFDIFLMCYTLFIVVRV